MAHHPDQYDRFLDTVDLDTDIEDLELDRRQLVLLGRQGRYMRDAFRSLRLDSVELHKELASVRRLVRQTGERIMARLDSVNAALDAVNTGLDSIGVELAQLATQIGDLSAGSVTQAEIDATAAKAQSLADRTGTLRQEADDLIEPDAGEEPPVEPEPPV